MKEFIVKLPNHKMYKVMEEETIRSGKELVRCNSCKYFGIELCPMVYRDKEYRLINRAKANGYCDHAKSRKI